MLTVILSRRGFLMPSLVFVALVIGIILRVYLAFAYRGNFDMQSFEIVKQIIEEGKNLYLETYRYNYSPLWAYTLYLLNKFSLLSELPFPGVVRSFLTIIDLINAFLIGRIANILNPGKGYISFLAYILNPVAILIIGYHGQFDIFATLPLLIAVYVTLKFSKPHPWVWLLGTLAILIKQIVVFGVWTNYIYVSKSKRKAFRNLILSGVVFLFSFTQYLPDGIHQILSNVILFGSITGMYGMGILFPHSLVYPLFIGLMSVIPLYAKKQMQIGLVKAMELSFVSFLALTPGLGEQYFIFPVIWGSIYRSRWYWLFTTVTTIFLLGSKNNLHLPIPSLWNSVWIIVFGWFLSYFLTWKK